jgi:DNA-binding YbaB/EbfC family protein
MLGPLKGSIEKMVMEQLRRLNEIQEALTQERVEASAGGGMVTVAATGLGELTEVKIAPEVVDPADIEMLQDLVLAAVKEVLDKAKTMQRERTAELTGGLDLPGLGGLLGG